MVKLTNMTMCQRMSKINVILEEISKYDRCFYSNNQDRKEKKNRHITSRFYTDGQELFFICARCRDSWSARKGSLQDKNCNGHTLNSQLETFREFILKGKPIKIYSDYWGYSYESLKKIHNKAKELNICENANFRLYDYSISKERLYNNKKEDGIPPTNKLVGILPKVI